MRPIDPKIKEVVNRYPQLFKLRNWQGNTFRLDVERSFIESTYQQCRHPRHDGFGPAHTQDTCPDPEKEDTLWLVLDILNKDGVWRSFIRVTPKELDKEIVR